MKTKSYKSFLSDYVKSMCDCNSLSVSKLSKEVSNNQRLLTLFSLYLLFDDEKADYVKRNQKKFHQVYNNFVTFKKQYPVRTEKELNKFVGKLNNFDELKKSYTSYMNLYVNKDKKLKEMYRNKIMNLQKTGHISNYRIYKDLSLNHGNVNDFLKNGHTEKLSLKQIERVYEYCKKRVANTGYSFNLTSKIHPMDLVSICSVLINPLF